jgi:hypothetical protein
MTVSASDHPHDDLLDSEAGGTRRPRPSRWPLLATGVALVLAGAAIVLVARSNGSEPAAPQDLSGSLLIVVGRSTGAALTSGTQEERDGLGTGSVRLDLPDRDLDGDVRVDFSASFNGEGETGPAEYFHFWGDIRLNFDSTTCRGSFGWSNFEPRLEGGGSMHARCEDGATLAATMVATRQVPGPNGISVELRDGWYIAGSTTD